MANNLSLLAACGVWLDHGVFGSESYSSSNCALQIHISENDEGQMLTDDVPNVQFINESSRPESYDTSEMAKVSKLNCRILSFTINKSRINHIGYVQE